MRKAHLLAPIKSDSYPNECIWFDTETSQHALDEDTVEHRLMFGWAAYRRRIPSGGWSEPKWLRFESKSEFWDWVASLQRPKTRLFMFCHNTSFDLPVLDTFRELPKRGYTLHGAVVDAPPTILRLRGERGSIQILDTLNIWRMPLAGLGASIGLPKLDFPSYDDPPEIWNTYAKRDVDIIMQACLDWFAFLKRNDMGGFANTLAAQALRTYRHKYLETPVLLDDNAAALAVSRRAYLGGRVECAHIGHISAPLTLLDINSMYPYVMREHLYPTSLRGRSSHVTIDDIERWSSDSCICAHVAIDTDKPAYPLRQDNKLLFPVGRFDAHLSTPELIYALEHNHIVKVHEAAVYSRGIIFRRFVDDMYAMRIAAAACRNDVDAWMFKILMNSLYGKFGQNGLVYEEVYHIADLSAKTWLEVDAETGDTFRWRQFGGLLQKQSKETEGRESHPAIAAHVTAYARMLLWSYMEKAGHDNYYYLDTDSLLVNDVGLGRLREDIDPSRLGALKVELTCDEVNLYGPKDYEIGIRKKTKGVRKSAVWLDASTVQQEKWSSLRGLISGNRLDAPTTKRTVKRLRREYQKGVVCADGTVRPFLLGADS